MPARSERAIDGHFDPLVRALVFLDAMLKRGIAIGSTVEGVELNKDDEAAILEAIKPVRAELANLTVDMERCGRALARAMQMPSTVQ